MTHNSFTFVRRSVLIAGAAALGFSMAGWLIADVPPTTTPSATAPAGPTATTAPLVAPASTDVDRLIAKLGDDDSDARDTAQKQLVELGQSAIASLKRAAESSSDPEIRSRAAAALSQMKDHDDNDASLITLHMKDASASDVLAAISKQSSSQIISGGIGRLAGVDNRTITIDADGKPFWDVMEDLCGQLNVCPLLDVSGRGQLRLAAPVNGRNWMQSPHQLCGPFWVSVASVYRARTIDLQGPAANPSTDDQFSVKLIIYPEPKLAIAQISDWVLKEATDNAGHSLLPKPLPAGVGRAAMIMKSMGAGMSGMGQMNRMVDTRLSYPDQPGTRIAILRGDVEVQLGSDPQQYIVDDVTGTQKVTNPLKNCTVQATVTRQTVASSIYIVNLTCTRDGLSDEKWSAMINRSNEVTLEDADGHPLTPLSRYNPLPSSDTSFKSMLYFASGPMNAVAVVRPGAAGAAAVAAQGKIGDPKRLTWNVATSLKTIKIPVVMKDLPMP